MLEKLKEYIKNSIKEDVEFQRWPESKKLPLVIKEQYEFYQAVLLNRKFLFAVAEGTLQAPQLVARHLAAIKKFFADPVVIVAESVTPYQRSQLIDAGVQFIIPGNQLFLPCAGMDLQERFREYPKNLRKKFAPATQIAFLYAMYQPPGVMLTPTLLTKATGFSIMTMNRAVDELRAAETGCYEERWRERFWWIENKQEAWQKALPFLRSPVKNILHCRKTEELKKYPLAGRSALAEYTMLLPGGNVTVAMTGGEWRNKFAAQDVELEFGDDDAVIVEMWSYDPAALASAGCVDVLSLFLAERDHADERTEKELERLLDGVL